MTKQQKKFAICSRKKGVAKKKCFRGMKKSRRK